MRGGIAKKTAVAGANGCGPFSFCGGALGNVVKLPEDLTIIENEAFAFDTAKDAADRTKAA